jgi:hypothetical protein
LALSPEQRAALAKLAPTIPPALAEAFKRALTAPPTLAKRFKQLDPRVREAHAELARLRRKIALLQQAASEIEAWLEREVSIAEPKPAPKPKLVAESKPRRRRSVGAARVTIAAALRAGKISDEAAVEMGPAAVGRLTADWAKDEAKRTGKSVAPPSPRSVGRYLADLREKLEGR